MTRRPYLDELPESIGYRWSRVMCRLLDRHDRYCRGRVDHTPDQRRRTR